MRKIFLDVANKDGRKAGIDFEVSVLCHFSFCQGMYAFSTRFHKLYEDCFTDTPICKMKPIAGFKWLHNLQEYPVNVETNPKPISMPIDR